jgi:hypothetical protein
MTTMGYGNQAPSTDEGKLILYTLGFVSILLFGACSARAGRIVAAIFDDILGHLHWSFLTRPWVSCILWGALYYGWMAVVASIMVRWKEERLGESFTFKEGYWFAYISTTTVGLGDIFIEPEVILAADLAYAPFLFLIGFTFFAAFLGKLVDFYLLLSGNPDDSLVEIMLSRLQTTELPAAEAFGGLSDQVRSKTGETFGEFSDQVRGKTMDVMGTAYNTIAGVTDQVNRNTRNTMRRSSIP